MSTADEKEKMFSPSEEGGGTDMSAQPKLSSQEPAGSNSLEKIREILFGGQMQEFQRRCDRLEERLVNIAADLRADLKKSLDSLESSFRGELESWNSRFTAERNERSEAEKGLAQGLHEFEQSSEKRLGQLEEQAAKSQRELQQQILDRSRSLSEEIRQRYAEHSAILERAIEALRAEKADRSALAALFTELAMRLGGEPHTPGSE
ncbi:MAG TPA: hypothetical protein VKJ47_24615 [Candidatus Binatia bacterium]|nr:hypothetical protein [Candidatus Binatia bacterium]